MLARFRNQRIPAFCFKRSSFRTSCTPIRRQLLRQEERRTLSSNPGQFGHLESCMSENWMLLLQFSHLCCDRSYRICFSLMPKLLLADSSSHTIMICLILIRVLVHD